jgi:hypothetical protein
VAFAVFLIAMYAWVWLQFRPRQLTVDGARLQVMWPLKRRENPRVDITSARVVNRQELKGRSDAVCELVLADFGVDSAGSGRRGGGWSRCISRALIVSCGSSALTAGRGCSRQKNPRNLSVRSRVSEDGGN